MWLCTDHLKVIVFQVDLIGRLLLGDLVDKIAPNPIVQYQQQSNRRLRSEIGPKYKPMCNKRLRFRTARVENHSYYLDLFPKASNWADKKSIYEVTSERQALSTHIYLQNLLENHNHRLFFVSTHHLKKASNYSETKAICKLTFATPSTISTHFSENLNYLFDLLPAFPPKLS